MRPLALLAVLGLHGAAATPDDIRKYHRDQSGVPACGSLTKPD